MVLIIELQNNAVLT